MSFEFTPDVAIADVAFTAKGESLQELFQSCADAVINSLAEVETVKPSQDIVIEKKAEDIERLLFELLEEIIFIKDKDAMVFHDVAVKLNEKSITATATLRGDSIKPEEQELLHDVKAVTMHYWRVEKKNGNWVANVVLDI